MMRTLRAKALPLTTAVALLGLPAPAPGTVAAPSSAVPGPVAASAATAVHEEAVLESPASAVPAGSELTLEGRDFTAGEAYTLRLQGALREYELREVEPAEDGTFSLELAIPADVRPGPYQVVAVAPDGDIVARLDLTVLRGTSGSGAAPEGEGTAGTEPAGGAEGRGSAEAEPSGAEAARSDEMEIERSRSGMEWSIIGLLVGLAGGIGVGLLRKGSAGAG